MGVMARTGARNGDEARDVATTAPRDEARVRRTRSIAIAIALFALVALFYAATLVRLGGAVMNRAI
jgi:hypothetical protein